MRHSLAIFSSAAVLACFSATGAELRVTDFGADPTGVRPSHAEISAACAAAKDGDTVLFPSGTYALARSVRIERKPRLTLRGEPGAVIQMHFNPEGPESESSGAFCIDGCDGFRLLSLTVTTDGPIGCAGRIVGKDLDAKTVDFQIDAACPFTGREHFFQIDSCDEEGMPDRALEVHAAIHAVTNSDGSVRHVGMPYAVLGERLVRISHPKWASAESVTNGQRALLRYSRERGTVMWMSNSRGVLLQDVEIARTPAMGVMVGTGMYDVTFRRFCIRPAAGDPALHASNSDGIHVFGCAGVIRLEDCHFKGLGDDAFNVHTMGGEIGECDAEKGTASFFMRSVDRKPRPLGQGWAAAGDSLDVYDQKTFCRRGTIKLSAYKDGQAVFEPVKFKVCVGDIVANRSHQPTVRIKDCSFENTRARALLLQTSHASVENSLFRGFPSPAVLVTSDIETWNEMAPTLDTEIRGCTFEKCAMNVRGTALAAVVAKLNHGDRPSDYPAGALSNISVCENTFSDIGTAAVYVECAKGTWVRGNSMRRMGTRRKSDGADICMNHCADVHIDGNVTDGERTSSVGGFDNSPRLAEIFADHMVLQAGKPIRIFGYGEGRVSVSFCGREAVAESHLGRWRLELPAMDAGGPYEMSVDLGGRKQTLKDVMLGEVLVMAGQSNMQMMLCESTTKERFADPRIRMFSTTRLEKGVFETSDGWIPLDKKTAWAWSAIGCETAVRLAKATGRAVGVINCYQGASVIETWMPRKLALQKKFELAADKCSHHEDREDSYSLWNRNGRLYERQFLAFAGFPVASVSWYQGESNSHSVEEGTLYAEKLAAMIGQWREDLLDKALPFYVLQLAADTTGGNNHAAWNAVKVSQAKVAATVPGVTLVRTDDICESDKGIHPPTKSLIAERLSLSMLQGDASTRMVIPTCGSLTNGDTVADSTTFVRVAGGERVSCQGYNAWPMIQAVGDKLVCAYSRGSAHTVDEGLRGVFASVSKDGGATWSDEVTVCNAPEWGEVTVGKGLDASGAMLLWVRRVDTRGFGDGSFHDLWRTADGVAWEKVATPKLDPSPVQITDIFVAPGKGLMSLWFAGDYKNNAAGHSWGTLTSGDNGRTWTQRTVERGLSKMEWPTEPSAAYLGDGRILAIARTERGGQCQFQLTSTDFGNTWSRRRTNISDILESTPSLLFSPATGLVANYYYQRGARKLKCRITKANDIFLNPESWPPPKTLTEGIEERDYDAGNVNATSSGSTHYLAFYTGSTSNTEVRVVVHEAAVSARALR